MFIFPQWPTSRTLQGRWGWGRKDPPYPFSTDALYVKNKCVLFSHCYQLLLPMEYRVKPAYRKKKENTWGKLVIYSVLSRYWFFLSFYCYFFFYLKAWNNERKYIHKKNLVLTLTRAVLSELHIHSTLSFSKHRLSGPMLSISKNVRLSVCSLLRYRLNVFLPPLPEVGCPIF